MHFRNNQMHGMTFDDKALFTVNSSSPSMGPSSVAFNSASQGILANNARNYTTSAAALNADSNDLRLVNIEDDDEYERMRDYETSNDTERLIH